MKIDQRWYVQIFSIVLMFFVFWPLGIYFLISRNNASKQGAIFEGLNLKQSTVYATIFAVIAILLLTDKSVRPFFIIYAAGAAATYYYGKRNDKHIQRCHKYIDMIELNGITDLNGIAVECSIPYELCRNEISALILKGVFANATINDSQQRIVFNKNNKIDLSNKITVICNSCSARQTIIKGQSCQCEYCGNIIQG